MQNNPLTQTRRFRWLVPLFAFLGGAVLAGGGVWLMLRPPATPPLRPAAAPAGERAVALKPEPASGALRLVVPAVTAGDRHLPLDYTCYRAGLSPPLAWTGAPQGTRSFVVLMARPAADKTESLNWAVFDISGRAASLPAGQPKDKAELPGGAREARNDRGAFAYVPPCEPHGAVAYVFRLYALDGMLTLPAGVGKNALFAAMNGHVLDSAAASIVHDRTRQVEQAAAKVFPSVPAGSGTGRPPARNPPR